MKGDFSLYYDMLSTYFDMTDMTINTMMTNTATCYDFSYVCPSCKHTSLVKVDAGLFQDPFRQAKTDEGDAVIVTSLKESEDLIKFWCSNCGSELMKIIYDMNTERPTAGSTSLPDHSTPKRNMITDMTEQRWKELTDDSMIEYIPEELI